MVDQWLKLEAFQPDWGGYNDNSNWRDEYTATFQPNDEDVFCASVEVMHSVAYCSESGQNEQLSIEVEIDHDRGGVWGNDLIVDALAMLVKGGVLQEHPGLSLLLWQVNVSTSNFNPHASDYVNTKIGVQCCND